jgi:hypothetical protein
MMASKGLLRKEWILMRWSALGFVVVFTLIAISSFAPLAVGGIFDINEYVQMFSTMHVFFGAALFLHSLHTDMKQPDVWFHSPASIWKLLGVKALMAVLINFGSFLIWSSIWGTAYFIGGFVGGIPEITTLLKLFVSIIFFISVSLAIWVVYKIAEAKIGMFAILLVIILIFMGSLIWSILLLGWEMMGMASSFLYIIVSIVLFAVGADLLEKKVRY